MTYILKDQHGNILAFGETSRMPEMPGAETLIYIDSPISEYCKRLVLSVNGISGETIRAQQGGPDVQVDVSSNAGILGVDLNINGVIETVALKDGKGKLLFSTAHAGVFEIVPADRTIFCAAGQSIIAIEVIPNA